MKALTTARFPLELPAIITTANAELACVVDRLSLGGVFVRGAQLPMDTRLMLRFTLPHRAVLEIPCTARWPIPDGTGLMFDGLRAADTYALLRYIRAEGNATRRTPIDEVFRAAMGITKRCRCGDCLASWSRSGGSCSRPPGRATVLRCRCSHRPPA